MHIMVRNDRARAALFLLICSVLVFCGCSKSTKADSSTGVSAGAGSGYGAAGASGTSGAGSASGAAGSAGGNSFSGGNSAEKSNIIVGFSQIGAESAWRTCHTESVIKAAQDAGIQLLYANAEQKQENQIKAIRSFIVYQVDVIVFVPIVSDGWDNVLKEAKEAGIPVIIVDRKIRTSDESLYAGFIGSDGYTEGCSAAKFLLKKYEDEIAAYKAGRQNKVMNILELRGTDGSSMTDDRWLGFRDVIKDYECFDIVYSETGDFLRSRGKEIAQKLMAASGGKLVVDGKPIDIIYSHNDPMTLGFIEVLKDYNIDPGKDVTIVSIDAEQEAINLMKSGKINCVVECNPKFGPQVMELVQTLVSGGQIPRVTNTEEEVFNEFQNFGTIAPRGY